LRITLAQIDSTGDVERNLHLIRRAVDDAKVDGPSLVVFPEYAMYEKKVVDVTFATAAEPLDGAFGTALSDLAAQAGVALVVGMVERNPHDLLRPFNTVAVFGSDGSLLGRHRKIHLYDAGAFHESEWITRSDDHRAAVVDIAGRRLGLMTCNDLRFPGLGIQLATDGADLVAVCASWVPGPSKIEQWRVLAQARAVEHGYPVVAVSQAEPVSIGNSLIAAPDGTLVTRLGGSPEVRTATLPEGRLARV
jgi:predicted amidohydrolase